MAVSKAFSDLVRAISAASRMESAVLITGETGTGKRQAASALHSASSRANGRLVTVNCIGTSDERFELDLCGSQSGQYELNRKGALFLAEEGSLYIHEIAELSLKSQGLLMRCLDTGFYSPLGSNDAIRFNVRLLASTSVNLSAVVEDGGFRTDLFHLISSTVIQMPSLDDRLEDLPRLANSMLREIAGNTDVELSDEGLAALSQHSFTGNLPELRNILFRSLSYEFSKGVKSGSTIGVGLESIEKAISASGVINTRYANDAHQRTLVDHMQINQEFDALPKHAASGPALALGKKTGRWTGVSQGNDDDTHQRSMSSKIDRVVPMSEFTEDDNDLSKNNRLDINDSLSIDSEVGPLTHSSSTKMGSENKIEGSNFRTLKQQEKDYLLQLIKKSGGDKRAAAKIAGITLRTLYRKLED